MNAELASTGGRGPGAPLIVLGSANRDYTVVVDRHPVPGETVLGGDVSLGTGGKGANQAAAAARSGATPFFVGAVGDDDAGRGILAELLRAGVDTSEVTVVEGVPTGAALITVSASGENSIVVAAGANGRLDAAATTARVAAHATDGTVLLAQLEIPLDVVEAAAGAAVARGARFVLNLSPYREVSPGLLAICDPLVVNENEAAALVHRAIESVDAAAEAARELATRIRSVVVTLGGDGAVIAEGSSVRHLPARAVPVVDTTGAGDAFVGALAAGLASGDDLGTAGRRGRAVPRSPAALVAALGCGRRADLWAAWPPQHPRRPQTRARPNTAGVSERSRVPRRGPVPSGRSQETRTKLTA